jgi:hypothetical protein
MLCIVYASSVHVLHAFSAMNLSVEFVLLTSVHNVTLPLDLSCELIIFVTTYASRDGTQHCVAGLNCILRISSVCDVETDCVCLFSRIGPCRLMQTYVATFIISFTNKY